MKKVCCMIALAAITLGSVYAAVPVKTTHSVAVTDTAKTDTSKVKKKGMKMKKKMKKDTTATKM
jgi:opacity protein-like surface antigen